MARAAPWIVVCLITWAASARLPGDEGDPEHRPLIISSVSLPGDQRNDPASSFGSETKEEPAMNLAGGADRTGGHAGKTTGSISFISTRDNQGVVRSHSGDSTSDEGHENKHDSRTGYKSDADGHDGKTTGSISFISTTDNRDAVRSYSSDSTSDKDHENKHDSRTGYKSDGHYKEYSYYDRAGYGDNGFDHGRDDLIDFIHLDNGGGESVKELTDWDSYYVLKSRGQNCSDGGGGVHSCRQDSEDEDTDDSNECAHDDEDCDDSRARLRAYLGRDEDEEEEGSEVEEEDEEDEYLLKPKFLDDDSDDEDDGNDVNEGDNDDDDDDNDVYLYVDGNDTNLLSFLASPIEPEESDGAFRETENARNEEPVKSEAEELKKYVQTNKADQSPRADKSENVPEEIVAKSIGTAHEGEVAKRDASYASWMKSSPVIGSNSQQDPSFAHDTPTIAREREINAEYIDKKKLHDVVRKSEGPIPKEDEQGQTAMHTEKLTSGWFENTAPGVSVTETVNTNLNASPKANTHYDQNLTFMISRHDAVPYEEIYDTIMHSGQISDEEKTYIASLEQTRRLVNRLGGLETLLEKPKVHHIVKRQTNGGEACVLLKRRRRRAADEAGETERTSRIRRGISNVGRNLEQGNPRFRQLFSQYKTMCDFLSMAVFEK